MTRRTFLGSAAVSAVVMGLPAQAVPYVVRFGVNYVPRSIWWYCWQDWDIHSIQEDLDAIAALGMDHIRVLCLWPMFQPGINWVSESCTTRMGELLDAADRAGLDVQVTVLNAWVSGFQFMPAWVAPLVLGRKGAQSNMFVDPDVFAAESFLFGKLAACCLPHRRFLGFDVGNELGVLMNESNPATQSQADDWSHRIFRVCSECAPEKFHVNGVDHEDWFSDFGFSRSTLATDGAATVVHCYSLFTGALARYGPMGIGTLHLPEYMIEFAYAYQTNLRRPIWVEEIGVSPDWVPADQMTSHVESLVRNSVETGKIWGVTWWCSHDINPTIHGFNKLEYTLGLLDQQNRPKPLGKTLARLATELRRNVKVAPRETALSVPRHGLSPDPAKPDWTYANAFMKLRAAGIRPAIVLDDRAQGEEYLRSRGITKIIKLADVSA